MASASTCTVRPLGADGLPLVARLARCIWPAAYAGVLAPEEIAGILDRIYSDENLRSEIAQGHRFWAAYEDEEPVGYASGFKDGATIWLKKLYVLPDRQGRGIGRALMAAVIAGFAPAEEVALLVNRGNLGAQAFYRRAGFVCTGERPVQMGDCRFVDLVFAKRL